MAGLLLNMSDMDPITPWPIHSVEGGPWVTHIVRGWGHHLGVEFSIPELEKLANQLSELQESRQSQPGTRQVCSIASIV